MFDLIQGWGGKTGRTPFVQPKRSPTRQSWDQWIEHYKRGAELSECSPSDAKWHFEHILGIGESFSTKHLKFWSHDKWPILDNRIKLLLNPSNERASYDQYLLFFHKESKRLGKSSSSIERALFAFSRHYFPNNALRIHPEIKNGHDFIVAKDLEEDFLIKIILDVT